MIRFSKRIQEIEVSAIKRMPLLARSVPDAVSLGQGIPSLQTPPYIRNKVREWLDANPALGKYSLQPGLPELKRAVSRVVSEEARRSVDPEREIFISAGAMEALFAAIVSIIEEGDEVILFDPSYASHIEQVIFAGGTPVYVPLNQKDGWSLDVSALKNAMSARTRAIVVCNPGNPTGKVFSANELSQIAELACERDLVVIADETYDFLVYDSVPYTSLVSFPQLKDRLIACYSFSKQFAMTGWRVGYMFAPAEVIDQCLKVHDAVMICAPTISQYAALAALTEKTVEEFDLKKILQRRRDLACSFLSEIPELFEFELPHGAYYIFARYLKTDYSSEEFALRLLNEAKVIAIPGRAFGPSGERHIRFSYGGTEEEITEAFARIKKWEQTLK